MTKILLVEDDKSLREIYGVRLLAEGYDIISAGDGEEALAMAIKDRPGLIISDVMMPKISGFDMLDILRSTTETKDIRVIMMTALSSEDQRARGEQLGADRYLVKSQVGIEDVVRTVHEVLNDAPAPQAAAFSPTPSAGMSTASSVVSNRPISSGTVEEPTPSVVEPEPSPTPEPAPMPEPVPAVAPVPTNTTPISPFPSPIIPSPSSTIQPTTVAPTVDLPRPTAPFSTARPSGLGLSDRVINPLPKEEISGPDINELMDKALSGTSDTPVVPIPPAAPDIFATPIPVTQVAPTPVAPTPPSPFDQPLALPAPAPAPAPMPAPAPISTPVPVVSSPVVPTAPAPPTPAPWSPSPAPVPPSNPFVVPSTTTAMDFEETPRQPAPSNPPSDPANFQ